MRRIVPAAAVLFSTILVGCGPPVIYDTSHRVVRSPIVTASVDNGWLAVDETEDGVRAVVQLELKGPAEAADYVPLHSLRFHCSSGEHMPSSVSADEPRCPAAGAQAMLCPPDVSPDVCEAMRRDAEQTCLYTIRAEFHFGQMPHLDENQHFFTFGQTEQAVHWAKADPGS